MSYKVYELRELLKDADDDLEVVVVSSESGRIASVLEATNEYFKAGPGSFRTRGIVLKIDGSTPVKKICPDCGDGWEDDDDY